LRIKTGFLIWKTLQLERRGDVWYNYMVEGSTLDHEKKKGGKMKKSFRKGGFANEKKL
jgi:hypothetical protein